MKFQVEVTDLDRGCIAKITGDITAECYCAKEHEIPQAIKDVLSATFPKPEPKSRK